MPTGIYKRTPEMRTGKKRHSEESKRKIGLAGKGRKHTQEWKDNLREKMKGNTFGIANKGIKKPPFTEEHKKHLSETHKGKKHSEETKIKIILALKGKNIEEDSHNWKGNNAGYSSKHKWIVKKFGSPRTCEHCGRTDKKAYHWANIDHKYARERNEWMRLCQSCHIKWDLENNNRVNNYR